MTSADLNNLKETMLERVKQNFIRDGSLIPVAMLMYSDGGGEVIGTQYVNDSDQKAFSIFLRKHCERKKPVAIMIVSEAHMLSIPKERKAEYLDENGQLKVARPKNNDEASDVIVCSFETKLTSEVIVFETKSVGGVNLIVGEERKGKITNGNFKDILTMPIGSN